MDPTVALTDVEMSEAPPEQTRDKHISHLVDQPRVSKFTTGILTTSGWVPRANTSWCILRLGGSGEVDELLQCLSEEAITPADATTRTFGEHVTPEAAELDDEKDVGNPDQYLDYASYSRHVGWTGCALLEEDDPSPAPASVKLRQADVPVTQTAAFASTALDDEVTTAAAADDWCPSAALEPINEQINPRGDMHLKTLGAPGKQMKYFFHPLEHAWLLLFHTKIKTAAESGQNIKLPGATTITSAFNAFFEGRVLQDELGRDTSSRERREEKSIKGKIMKKHTKIWQLRDTTRRLLEGKREGEVSVPMITDDELRVYQLDGMVKAP